MHSYLSWSDDRRTGGVSGPHPPLPKRLRSGGRQRLGAAKADVLSRAGPFNRETRHLLLAIHGDGEHHQVHFAGLLPPCSVTRARVHVEDGSADQRRRPVAVGYTFAHCRCRD